MMSNTLEMRVVFSAIDRFVRPVANITRASREASKALSAAKSSLKDLNDQQKLIDKFKLANKSLGINGQDLEKARAHAKRLGEELQRTEKPTAAMQRAFKHATEEARHLAGTVNRMREQKQRLRQEMASLGIDTKSLASYQKDLKSKIDAATAAVTKQEQAVKQAGRDRQRMYAAQATSERIRAAGDKAGRFGRGALAAGAGVGALMSAPILAYAKAEDATTELMVAMMKKGGEVSASFKEIDALANRLGNKLPGATSDYQNMMTMLIRQGMPAKNILAGLGEATAYLAVQLKMPPEAAAEFASKLQDATRTADKDMMALMDTIQKAFYLGVDQGNLLQAFAKLSPALSVIKTEGAEAARALAPLLVMTDQAGMGGEASGNAFRKIFQMSLDAKKVAKGNAALAGSGVQFDFTDGKGEFGGMDKMFVQLEALRAVNTQKRLAALKEVFGDDAETLQALNVMIEKGKAGYDDVQRKLADQASLQERVNAQLGTLSKLWDAASGTFTNALVKFGESISPELHQLTEWLGTLAERTQNWAQENPGLAATLMTIGKWSAIILLGVGALGVVLGAIAAPIALLNLSLAGMGLNFGLIFGALSKLVHFVAAAVRANPMALLFAGAVAVIGHVLQRLDELKDKFAKGDWWGIGRVIMESLIAGFDSMTFGLFSKVIEIIKGITQRIAKAFGFNPFSGADSSTPGMPAGTPSPAASVAPKKVEVRTLPPVVAPVPQRLLANSNNSYVFNIHPSAGMDERGLAQLVRDEISKSSQQDAARLRSRLRDQE